MDPKTVDRSIDDVIAREGLTFDRALARVIDHTLLRPEAAVAQIEKLCIEARAYSFASVCVNPCHVPRCVRLLAGSGVAVCTVIGFPLGATSSEAKKAEAEQALRDGAGELDMVINVGMLKSGLDTYVEADIASVTSSARSAGALTKVIIETGLLTDDEKVRACVLASRGGADFVKTCTGFGVGRATVEDVRLMRRAVGSAMGVKASGGVRSREDALAMIASGANRIGASASVRIVTGGGTTEPKGPS